MSTPKTKKFQKFSDALVYVLTELDVGQNELARRLQTDHSVISRYANDKTTPGRRTIRRIEKALGVTIHQREDGYLLKIQEKPEYSSGVTSVEDKIEDYLNRKEAGKGFSDSELDRLISILEDHVESTQAGLRLLKSELKKR